MQNMEFAPKPTNKIEQKTKEFDVILELLKNNEAIEFEQDQKINFLNYVVQNKGYLLHGSGVNSIQQIKPHSANCSSKEFGNQDAVFANKDPFITMFYALKNKDFEGVAESSSFVDSETGKTEYKFKFKTSNPTSEYCLSKGSIYLLERDSFIQGSNDVGELIDEWASPELVSPIAKIDVNPEDFPYLSQVKYIKQDF